MATTIKITSKDGQDGRINYSLNGDGKVLFTVEHPDGEVAAAVDRYLNTEREYWIPESDRIDDYRVDNALPTDGETYFNLALNTLHARTGVFVHWDTEKEV